MPLPGHFIVRLGFGLLILLIRAPATLAESAPCRAITHEGSDYTVCERICGGREVVKFFRKKATREPYGYLSSLPQSLGEHPGRLLFAINAGMYHPDYRPVGLYIENGRELAKKAKTHQAISRTHCVEGRRRVITVQKPRAVGLLSVCLTVKPVGEPDALLLTSMTA